ncbi:MAG: MarR family winged helix-turn-helix transcriptional regulator [Candidatus Weimeria sp.]
MHDSIISENEHLVGYQMRMLEKNMRNAFETLQYKTFPDRDRTTVAQGWVVGYLYRHSELDIYQKDLENTFHMAPSTITAIVKNLEKSGLIKREAVEKDARLKRIVLTEKGLEFQKKTMENFDKLERKAVEGIPKDDLDKFFEVVFQIKKNVENFAE